ncbi:MAG: hypothetical protein ACJ8H8_13070 [Geminicoccaceae bacterium]
MPQARSPAQQAAARTNGARSRGPATAAGKTRSARNGTRHGLRGGPLALLPGEDRDEFERLRLAVAADWRPRDAYERHWIKELVAAMWRQDRLRGLELAALLAAERQRLPSEASLKRLLTFARYGARIDKDIGRALDALRVLKRRADNDLAEVPERRSEPRPRRDEALAELPSGRTTEPRQADGAAPRTREPDLAAVPPPASMNRHERRRLEALERRVQRRAA